MFISYLVPSNYYFVETRGMVVGKGKGYRHLRSQSRRAHLNLVTGGHPLLRQSTQEVYLDFLMVAMSGVAL